MKVHCGFVDPEQGPAVHPAKTSPESATAVSVICEPVANCAVCVVQDVPHESPAGALETSPVPLLAASLLMVMLTSTPNWSVSPMMLLLDSGSPYPFGKPEVVTEMVLLM